MSTPKGDLTDYGSRPRPNSLTDFNELDHVDTSLATLNLRNVGLRLAQFDRKFRLGEDSGFARVNKCGQQLPIALGMN